VTDVQKALSGRALACKGFRWLPGMRWIVSRVAPLEDYAGRIVDGGRRAPDGPGIPDLSDPATAGALLSILLTVARARFVVVEIEDDWRTRHAEVRLVDVVSGGWHPRAAFTDMPLGEAVALALLMLDGAP